MPEDKDKNHVFYVTHSGELLIWLIVLLVFVAFSSIGFIAKEITRENDYRIFLQDVDGLIVGSPVRMMGVEVGYVTKIKPTKSEVYVKFILTNPDVFIPQGTTATVEFSGMAGSKSLELYLPDKNTYVDNSTPAIEVSSPKRLHDALWLLNDMYKKISSIIYTGSSFGKKLNLDLGEKGYKTSDIESFLKYSDEFLDEATEKADEMRDNLKKIKGDSQNDK